MTKHRGYRSWRSWLAWLAWVSTGRFQRALSVSVVVTMSAVLLANSQIFVTAARPSAPAAVPTAPLQVTYDVAGLEETGQWESSTGATEVLRFCTLYTRGDYVHRSSTGIAASAHGWWENRDCPATYAVVTVQLQEYYSDGTWRNVGEPGRKTVRSGGGAGNRATARVDCLSTERTGWRSVVDVDLVGVADDPGALYTPAVNIECRR